MLAPQLNWESRLIVYECNYQETGLVSSRLNGLGTLWKGEQKTGAGTGGRKILKMVWPTPRRTGPEGEETRADGATVYCGDWNEVPRLCFSPLPSRQWPTWQRVVCRATFSSRGDPDMTGVKTCRRLEDSRSTEPQIMQEGIPTWGMQPAKTRTQAHWLSYTHSKALHVFFSYCHNWLFVAYK